MLAGSGGLLAMRRSLVWLHEETSEVLVRVLEQHVRAVDHMLASEHEGAAEIEKFYNQIDRNTRSIRSGSGFMVVARRGETFSIPHVTRELASLSAGVPPEGPLELLRLASAGEPGTYIGPDVRGIAVIAAYHPLSRPGWGVVSLVEKTSLEARYLGVGWSASGLLTLVLLGVVLILHRARKSQGESRELLASLGRATDDGMAALSEDGRTLWCNAKLLEMLGADEIETPPSLLGRLQRTDDGRTLTAEDCSGRDRLSGLLSEGEIRLLRLDGAYLPVSASVGHAAIAGRDRTLLTLHDLASVVQAQEAMEASERRYRELMERSPGLVSIVTVDGMLMYANPAQAAILERDVMDLLGTNLLDVVPESHREMAREAFARLERDEQVEVMLPVELASGETRTLMLRALRYEQDEDTTYVLCNAVDLTDQINAQQDLEEAHQSLSLLLEAIPSILIGVDGQDQVTLWNGSAEEAFGIASEEALARPLQRLGMTWTSSSVGAHLDAVRDGERHRDMVDLVYQPARGGDGLLDLSVRRLDDSGGEYAGALLLATDVTEQRQLERQLSQAQKLESIGQLAAGIAHEINTPTQYVGDNIDFLRDAFDDVSEALGKYHELRHACGQEQASDALLAEVDQVVESADLEFLAKEIPSSIDQARDGVKRVSEIVMAMKSFSHPGSESKTAVDLNRALESTLTVSRSEWKYVAEMETELSPNLPPVPCHPGELNQVFLNLIVNAAHAIRDVVGDGSQGKGHIAIRTRAEGGGVVVEVVDDGGGIPEEIRGRIFDPFFTTKEVGKGTGQGLSIAHSVVTEKHGGRIEVESEPGEGTCFRIWLPLDEPDETDPEAIG
ncbi:MAG: PAS domain S-box protein [Proteobacteria bacterium]|nr:PAS domain S-box protein [Pseudomonadota bacterium]